MKNQPRVDPVVAELITGVRGSEDSISTDYVHALANVVNNASNNTGGEGMGVLHRNCFWRLQRGT